MANDDWNGELDNDLVIRALTAADIDRIDRIDEQHSGRNRRTFFEGKLQRALSDSDVSISLGAEKDGILVGALMGALHYGEYGLAEPVAILDTILVDSAFSGQGIARGMMDQLVKNLQALRVEVLRTEVEWNELALLGYLAASGFEPAHRLVLERSLVR